MKEKFRKIMASGGWTLIIATLAIGAYLLVVQFADNLFYKNVTNNINITVNDDGELAVNYEYDDGDIYILWETDGGNIKPVKEDNIFKEQNTDDNNWYCAYTDVNDSVKWNSSDADGNNYKTATVRAIIYQKSEDQDVFYINDYIKDVSITVTYKDGKVEKSDDRVFSCPIREGVDNDWNQIYVVQNSENGDKTLKYRTSKLISTNDVLVLCWKSDAAVLAETDQVSGSAPYYGVMNSNKNKNELRAINEITVKRGDISGDIKVEAFLVDESVYKNEEIKETDKQYIATINITDEK